MRNLLLTCLLTACTTYPTLDEACNDTVPGGDLISDDVDRETARWMNCHRRMARAGQARVHAQLQPASEEHIAYLEANTPLSGLEFEIAGNPGFTGQNSLARVRDKGWASINGSRLLSLFTIEPGTSANQVLGNENFDLWFAYPVFRQAWLQNPNLGFGVSSGDYVVELPGADLDDVPLSMHYWHILYQTPAQAYAQAPVVFPPKGATDVPSLYVHLVDDSILEPLGEYGYPITFTVGAGEKGMVVNSAALIGPAGAVSITVVEGGGLQGLGNTAIIVPDDPLVVGAEYTCSIELTTDQGTRRASTTFSVGSRSLPNLVVPAAQARTAAPGRAPLRMGAIWSTTFDKDGPLQAR